jgi:hypothetical protein
MLAVCDVAIIELAGCCVNHHAGNSKDAYVDFADPGGINTIKRSISPRHTESSLSSNRQ